MSVKLMIEYGSGLYIQCMYEYTITTSSFFLLHFQLYDWTQTNKRLLLELCREQQSGDGLTITTDAFTSVLQSMGAPLESEHLTSLLNIYDKKGEGVVNYDDYISEQKYIHAVSQWTM